ncbi:MAG TPA: DNA topoisomerase [Methanosarcina sp.]|nr:DNA topoisomerase [Methanosarcina sp.]
MTVVAFAEKNKAAAQIASILGDGEMEKIAVEGLPAYEFKWKGEEWLAMGLSGHIMNYDFPKQYSKWSEVSPGVLLGVDPEKLVTRADYAAAVKTLAKRADKIILACDYDREGENIGFEAKTLAEEVTNVPVARARFSALSPKEVKKAFENLVDPDYNMAMAAEARQILDLKMGASFTRFVTLSVREKARTKDVLSIGPCQTPTCGFVYEREKAIRAFQSKDFWKITAIFSAKDGEFEGTHRAGNIHDKEKAAEIFKRLKGTKEGLVAKKTVKEAKISPPNPLNTTEFLKRASKFLGISPEVALELAEQLYLGGFTSYPRTETNKYADDFEFKSLLLDFARQKEYKPFAESILIVPIVPKNGEKDAHDHPPIHPIRAASRGEISSAINLPHASEVYDLIARHFLANLMPAAVFEKTHLHMLVQEDPFDSSGTVLKASGWLEVYPFENKKDKLLPFVEEREKVGIKKLSNTKSKTSPPKKLTEAELLTLMDKNGIGTKATAPTHIETNKKRGYFETKGKTVSILDTGFTLMEGLSLTVPILVKPEIRAKIEALIQEVEDGKKEFEAALDEGTTLIREMYSQLEANKKELTSSIAGTIKDEAALEDKKNYVGTCKACGHVLRIVQTDSGRFVGCTGYPDCRNSYPLPKTGTLTLLKSKECKKEGAAVLKVGNKYNWAVGIGPCFTCDLEKECYPPETVGPCPECDGNMFLITFKDTRFLGCTKRCGYTHSVPKTGKLALLDKKCEICGWKIFRLKEEGESPEEDFCVNRRCKEGRQYWKKISPGNEARIKEKATVNPAVSATAGSRTRKVSRVPAVGRKEKK